MSGSVNKVILLGNVGRDPEVKSFPNGGMIASFSLATSERWTDKQSGEKKERTEWHTVVARSEGLVRVVENYVRKGSKVFVEGQLQTREWTDKDGQKRYSTEVVLTPFGGSLTLLSDPPGQERGGKRATREERSDHVTGARTFAADLDDDIPF